MCVFKNSSSKLINFDNLQQSLMSLKILELTHLFYLNKHYK